MPGSRADDVDGLIDALIDAVGPDAVLTDADLRAGHERDWTGRYGAASAAVVRPSDTAGVAAVIDACRRHGAAIVPQGGNTGLVGGGVPRDDTRAGARPFVVLATSRLDEVGDVDVAAMQVTVGAGVTIADWRRRARGAGLDTGVDFAARDSATVGGAVATNAGGSRVVRFGTMRSQVVGVEAVLADGSVVGSLSGLPKETAGLHWPSLLVGSEGTLGVVTRVRTRLVPWYRHTATALVALGSIDDAIELLRRLRAEAPNLDAAELVQPDAYDLVLDHLGIDPPVARPDDDGSLVIVECAAHHDPTGELADVLAAAPVLDTAMATDPAPRERLLSVRDRLTESIASASTALGTPTFKLDVAVPVDRLGELLDAARRAAADDGCRLIPFGHLAEGNVHLNHLGVNDADRLAATVLGQVAALGGTISAEHGIGVAKVRHLGLIRSDADLAAQRAIADALDPDRVLNPGVLGR